MGIDDIVRMTFNHANRTGYHTRFKNSGDFPYKLIGDNVTRHLEGFIVKIEFPDFNLVISRPPISDGWSWDEEPSEETLVLLVLALR